MVVICDNATIHHSGITQRRLATHPRLLLVEGARYNPQDNPSNTSGPPSKPGSPTPPATMAGRIRQADTYFRHRTPQQTLATAEPWSCPWLPDGYGQDLWSAA